MPTSPDTPIAPTPVAEAVPTPAEFNGLNQGLNLQQEQANSAAEANLATEAGKNLDTDPKAGIDTIAEASTSETATENNGQNTEQNKSVPKDEAKTENGETQSPSPEDDFQKAADEASDRQKEANEESDARSADMNQETENTPSAKESTEIPEKVVNSTEFKRAWGDAYEKAKASGNEIDYNALDQQALSNYYENSAKSQLEKGLPESTVNDPLYQQKLGEAMTRAQKNGEPLDASKLSQEALVKFQKEKDLQTEEVADSKTEKLTTDQQLQEAEQKIAAIFENNGEKLESVMVSVSAKDLALLLKGTLPEKEASPKKKENLLSLILKIIGIMAASLISDVAKGTNSKN
jgi:hypothetical protein